MELPNVHSGTKILEHKDGDTIWRIEVRLVSHYEWMAIDLMFPKPKPPASGASGKIVYNYENPEYRKELEMRNEKVQMHRLAESITAEIPGDSVDEKIKTLTDTFTMAFLLQLYLALMGLHTGVKVEPEEARFQRERQAALKSARKDGVVA